jgi:sec-independent protein translocase protein TatB
MIDLGISKIAIIGVIALVVLGPERLPKVARTLGALLGRARRYIAEVKSEVGREMDLDELRKMKDTVQSAASSFESSVSAELYKTGTDLNAALEADINDAMLPLASSEPQVYYGTLAPKRKDWRKRQQSTPLWYRNASRKRTRVLSGAARVARYRYKKPA